MRLVPRHAGLILVIALALTALAATQVVDPRTGRSRIRVDASADQLLQEGDASREFYDHVRRLFGTDETLLVALAVDDVFTTENLERIARLTQRLEELDGVHHVLSLTNAIDVRGVDYDLEIAPFVTEIPRSPGELAALRQKVMENPLYAGSLVSRSGGVTALVVYFADMSHQEYVDSGLDQQIVRVAKEERGDAQDLQIWIAGGPHLRAETAAIFLREALTLPGLMLIALGVVLAATFRTARGVALPLATVAISVCWTMGLAAALDYQLNAITSLVPPLLTTLALSYAVHVVSEYYDVAREGKSGAELVVTALQRVALPVAITGLTTAIGFASLALSPLGAVREFGILSVIGVACTVAASLTFTPAVLALLGRPSRLPRVRRRRGILNFDRTAERIAHFDVANRRAIFIGCFGIFALALFGASQLRVGTQQIQKFRDDAPVRVDFEAVNQHLEGANLFYVILETDVSDGFLEPEDLREIEALQTWLEQQPEIGGTTSIVDYLKLINRGFHGNEPAHFTIPDRRSTVRQLLVFGGSDELDRFVDAGYRTASIQVRARVVDSDAVSELTERVEARLAQLPRRMKATVTGTAIVFNRALDAIIRGQAFSIVAALAVIYAILAAMFVSMRTGLIALAPNALPIVVYFGALGFTGVRLDPGTSLIAPMVLGIAVDDTIHYFARFIREARRHLDEQRAVVSALKSVGRPVTYTSLALCLGFLVLNASELRTLAEVGSLAAFALAFAWATDFFLTPALCARLRIVTLWDLLTIDLGRDPQNSIPLFQGLSARQARVVALMASVWRVPAGHRLFEAGEPGDALYVVIDGRLRASLSRGGKKLELASYQRGGVCGEVGLFHEDRTADVEAMEDARLLRLTQGSLDELGRRYPRIAAVVFHNLNQTLAAAMARATQRELAQLGASELDPARQATLETRGRALQDAFFRREADAYRAQLLERERESGGELPASARDGDPALIDRLTGLGIRADTLAALTLIPLVEVAWADGRMDASEKHAVLRGAESSGITPDSPSFGLLRLWLDRRPDQGVMDLWRAYIEAVCGALSVEARMRLRDAILGCAREVAAAAGGVLGVGAISQAEERVLSELESAFPT